jgi:cbb3-type cytochrome oxidase subunit 1
MARGALLLLPIAIIVVFVTDEHPLRTLGTGLLIFCLAVAGAALSGLAYSFVGRRVRETRFIGPYLAGWLSTWPYLLVVLVIIRLHKGIPLTDPFAGADWFVLAFGTLYAGTALGWMFFRDV